jgi:tRNA pseudouridine38-40 synthase
MRYVRLTIAYDGTDYFGWQFQPDKRTIQGTLEAAVADVTTSWTRIVASSRTDAGVHAVGQAVSFPTETRLENDELRKALNAVLPFDMVVREVRDVRYGFNATRESIRKRYRYVIHEGRIRDPIGRGYSWHVPYPLDVEAMQAGAKLLLGEHDFAAYESTGSKRETSVRTVYDLVVERREMEHGERVVIEIEANGFLYNMVRNIAGTLALVGRGKYPPSWMGDVLKSLDRRRAGMTAPPQALFLLWVKFPDDYAAEV